MVITCLAPGCNAKKDSVNANSSVLFHRFPLRKPDVLAKWVKAMKNPNFRPTVKSYLCSAHFSASDYEMKPNIGKHLKPNSVPVIFEKRRPGRKKKIQNEAELIEDAKENEEEKIKHELDETVEEEYLEPAPNDKEEFTLAEIIGNQEKETLQILIVGEDGKIINSDYIIKNEFFTDNDLKSKLSTADGEDREQDTDDESGNQLEKHMNNEFVLRSTESPDISIVNYKDLKTEEKIRGLETSLVASRKKVKVLQLRCRKLNKKLNRLKILLKLLVLKKGKGEKNLKQLLEEKEMEDMNAKIKIEESTVF